jgi:nitrate reductase beta subunit
VRDDLGWRVGPDERHDRLKAGGSRLCHDKGVHCSANQYYRQDTCSHKRPTVCYSLVEVGVPDVCVERQSSRDDAHAC